MYANPPPSFQFISSNKQMYRTIKNFEGIYDIDENGNVYSHRTNRVLKNVFRPPYGYMTVSLYDSVNKKTCSTYVHRLVAETFLPKPSGRKEVNHKDGDKSNNILSNLEWCSSSENIRHAFKNGLMKKRSLWKVGKLRWTSFDKRTGRWLSVTRDENKKFCYGGTFKTEEEAHQQSVKLLQGFYSSN